MFGCCFEFCLFCGTCLLPYVLCLLVVGLLWRLFVVIVYVEFDLFSDDGFDFVEDLLVFTWYDMGIVDLLVDCFGFAFALNAVWVFGLCCCFVLFVLDFVACCGVYFCLLVLVCLVLFCWLLTVCWLCGDVVLLFGLFMLVMFDFDRFGGLLLDIVCLVLW